jgi:hypothetical protein
MLGGRENRHAVAHGPLLQKPHTHRTLTVPANRRKRANVSPSGESGQPLDNH